MMIATQYSQYLIKIYERNIEKFHQNAEKKTTFITYSENDSMEEHIRDFKSNMKGVLISNNKTYVDIKSPREYFRTTLVSNKLKINRPWKLKVRSPRFYNLSTLNNVCAGNNLSNLLAYLSTLNLILRETDR